MKTSLFKSVLVTALLPLVMPVAFAFLPSPAVAQSESGMEALKRLPIQDSGRIKPFDTFARESLQLIYGRTTYRPPEKPPEAYSATEKGDSGKPDKRARPAMEIVVTWFLAPQFWDEQPIIELKLAALKKALDLELTRDRFTPRELFVNSRLGLVFQDLTAYRETKAKLTPYYQAVARLESQIGVYQAIKEGALLRFIPPSIADTEAKIEKEKTDPLLPKEPDRWRAISEVDGAMKESFAIVAKSFIRALPGGTAPAEDGLPTLDVAVKNFQDLARAENPKLYPDGKDIGIEVHYEELHPFRLAWILYVLSAIAMAMAWVSPRRGLTTAGWVLAIIAFAIHTYGFGLRVYLTGRPPVSNMYESVIWVSWGTILFAFFFEYKQRVKFILMSGAIVATLCNIVADSVPHVLDASLQPLEPVLRSTLWLTVHVLTITISYSAFFLAWMLGNLGLAFVVKGDGPASERIDSLTIAIYRCMQVGVVLLAAGTILGGVWADYSWGRFWGWDPKETWALIALLGYVALLHARLSGWVKHVGMLVGAVTSFNLVIMAWYGVNFVLGAGLHSYGFGAGGVEYVSGFILVNMAFVGYAYALSRGRSAPAVS
ncbi:MAG: cytochrome c biogenesis protein CcsA [Bdellovibrionales bacterium]|nr:cytochrome c biogenesis protein CcsA [Bdellovibrionales bacterium]